MDGEIVDVKIGQPFSPDEWAAARNRMQRFLNQEVFALRLIAPQAADAFAQDATMALAAMMFVGESASEQVRFIPIKTPPTSI